MRRHLTWGEVFPWFRSCIGQVFISSKSPGTCVDPHLVCSGYYPPSFEPGSHCGKPTHLPLHHIPMDVLLGAQYLRFASKLYIGQALYLSIPWTYTASYHWSCLSNADLLQVVFANIHHTLCTSWLCCFQGVKVNCTCLEFHASTECLLIEDLDYNDDNARDSIGTSHVHLSTQPTR